MINVEFERYDVFVICQLIRRIEILEENIGVVETNA